MFRYSRDVQFKEIPQSEDCESLNHGPEQLKLPSSYSSIFSSQLFIAILIPITLIVGILLGTWLGRNRLIKANEFCIHQVSQDCKCL